MAEQSEFERWAAEKRRQEDELEARRRGATYPVPVQRVQPPDPLQELAQAAARSPMHLHVHPTVQRPPASSAFGWGFGVTLGVIAAVVAVIVPSCGGLGILGSIGTGGRSGVPAAGPGGGRRPLAGEQPPDYFVNAPALLRDYKANEVAADSRYKGHVAQVAGRVDRVGKDILDTPYVTLAGDGFLTVQCMFTSDAEPALAGLRPGQSVTICGRVEGKMGNVLLRECALKP